MADRIFFAEYNDVYIFKFVGSFDFTLCPAVEGFMRKLLSEKALRPVVIDMTATTGVDSTGMGMLAQIAVHSKRMLHAKPTLLVSDNDILKILKGMDFESVFNILQSGGAAGADFKEIEPVAADEKEMTHRILAAHRTLMNMSPENRVKFQHIVKTLGGTSF